MDGLEEEEPTQPMKMKEIPKKRKDFPVPMRHGAALKEMKPTTDRLFIGRVPSDCLA